MSVPSRGLRAAVLGAALLLPGVAAAAQAGSTVEERRPNVVPPLSQFGTWGSGKGQFAGPRGAAISATNRLYIADTGNHRIQAFLSDGTPVVSWGRRGSGPSEFLFPSGIAIGPDGDVFVSDTGNDRVQVFDADGTFRRQWSLRNPGAIAASGTGVVVAEPDSSRLHVFTSKGEGIGAIGEFGDGPGQFKHPSGVAFDENGDLYVADAGNQRIQKIDRTGRPLAQWGTWGFQEGLFADPRSLAYAGGRVYVADSGNHRVQVFDRTGAYLYQWGRAPVKAFQGDGRLHLPSAIAVSSGGGLTVVCEPYEHRCQVFANGSVRKVTPVNDLPWWEDLHARMHLLKQAARPATSGAGPFTAAAPPAVGAIGDAEGQHVFFFNMGVRPPGFVARAGGFGRKLGEFIEPSAIALDPGRWRAYVSDRGNRRIQLLELQSSETSATGFAPEAKVIGSIEPAGAVPETVEGYRRDLSSIEALALDPSGNLLAVDAPNAAVLIFDPKLSFLRVVRGPTKSARWTGVAASPEGKRVYVVDAMACQVHAFDAQGRLDLSWGKPGDDPAQGFIAPCGVAVDGKGFVYVTDRVANVIKKFDANGGWVATWAGLGREWGKVSGPAAIAFWKREGEVPDRIVVDDVGNHRAQIFTTEGKVYEIFVKGGSAPPPPPK